MPPDFSEAGVSKPKTREFSITRPRHRDGSAGTRSIWPTSSMSACLKLLRDVTGTPDGGKLAAHRARSYVVVDVGCADNRAGRALSVRDPRRSFTGVEWWRESDRRQRCTAAPHTWPANVSEQLMSETLVFAWHTAKWDRRVARLSLGVLPAVAELIAAPRRNSSQPSRGSTGARCACAGTATLISGRNSSNVARDGDEEGLAEIHLHAKLLLLGELIAQSSLARGPGIRLSGHESVRRVAQLRIG